MAVAAAISPGPEAACGVAKRRGPQRFSHWTHIQAYMKTQRRYPVVKKIRAKTKDDEVQFELCRGCKTLPEAQTFLAEMKSEDRLDYLIWYVPESLET